MKRFIRLTELEWKRAVKAIPLMVGEAVILCLFLGTVMFLCQKLFYGESMLQRIPVGLVLEEENKMTELALTYLEGMESTSAACEFLKMNAEEGKRALERGEIAALMVLPEEMMEAILDSRNYPVKVYFPKASSFGSLLIRELTEAGAGMLSMAQAQVYAAYDMNVSYRNLLEVSQLETDINLFNMQFAMARERMLKKVTLQISEEVPLILHYLAAGITVFLMLWGIACSRFLKGDSPSFGRQLLRGGIRRWQWMAARLSGVFLVLGIGACGILVCVAVMQEPLQGLGIPVQVSLGKIPYLLAVLVCISAFLLFCYQAAPTRSSGMILVFTITIVMVFVSGGFLPSVFLPEAVNRIAAILPCTAFFKCMDILLGAEIEAAVMWQGLMQLLVWTGVFYLAALFFNYRRGEADQ